MVLLDNFILLFTESAPYLLLGLLLAGIIRMLVPDSWITKFLGEKSSVVTAAIIGTPLPLCSCSVIPTAIGIRRAGASKASTASFMVSTPETGVDSIGVTLALMGPVMAIARPISAIISAIVTGTLVRLWDTETPPIQEEAVKSCCGGKKEVLGFGQKMKNAVVYGYGKLLSDFMGWLLIGIGFAALIQTYVPPTLLSEYGNGIFAMLIAVVISIPMYICATASTPVAAGLMLSGISPGAALVFMLTGPATNIATLMVVKNELGIRSLMAYLTGVIVTALAMGLTLDWIVEYFQLTIEVSQGEHGDMTSLLYSASAIILAGLIIWQYGKKLKVN
ncbi:MAG: SO_0444 family Cu/Zn efflux transporter [Oleispira antarctica]|nr:SO_0444 family Cu/Zn efflux transporter [Oleispira antarctica]MBQ0794277.1 SO_0444 family Cu/Zn efflux transporter [Oleispira antarctica]